MHQTLEMVAIPSNSNAIVAESTTGVGAAPKSETRSRATREVRHDLGNALGALRLRVQLVLGDAVCRAAQAKNLEAIERILNRAMALFEELGTHSRATPKSRAKARGKKARKAKARSRRR
jgi:hypothetical protein